ncbi:MAG: hypothetical protein WBD36_08225 [Bacteroidota bacterium]
MSLFVFPVASLVSQIIVVIAAARTFRNLPVEMRILAAYFGFSLFVGLLQMILALNRIQNLWTSQFSLPIEFTLLMLVFYYSAEDPTLRKILFAILLIFVAFWSSSISVFGLLRTSHTYFKTATSAVLVLASCYILARIAAKETETIFAQAMFWVATGSVMYFGGTIVLFALSGAIFKSSLLTMRLAWSMQSVLNVVANLIYLRGFLCFRQK